MPKTSSSDQHEFTIGDRVVRARDLYDDRGLQQLRRGVVVDVYLSAMLLTMYEVKWDDSSAPERGYIGVGLTREATSIA